MKFHSEIQHRGEIVLPGFTGTRLMMQPFKLEALNGTLPNIPQWHTALVALRDMAGCHSGTAYLTLDEAEVEPGRTHRRPGLHVDGIGPDGKLGGWGGGGGGWGSNGMLVVSSRQGCRAWGQEFNGAPKPNGDCAHLADQCTAQNEVLLKANQVYWCSALTVHEGLPLDPVTTIRRQFVRLSLPSPAPWYEGYTPSPVGVLPDGPIHPRRDEFMAFRPQLQPQLQPQPC